MENIKFGFIGAGNMGGALARALSKKVSADNIMIADTDSIKCSALAEEIGAACSSNEQIAKTADYIFLGVKPQVMEKMLSDIKQTVLSRAVKPILVSMAAGLSCDKILSFICAELPIIRIMPNIPVSVGEGMILYTSKNTADNQLSVFTDCMSEAGLLDMLDEKLIDAASAVSGCGPAFAYMFIEALSDGAVECGVPRDKAIKYAAQTLLGAAKTVLEGDRHPAELKDAVCSPQGTTIAGVHALENGGFRAASMNAVKSAYDKTLALGK